MKYAFVLLLMFSYSFSLSQENSFNKERSVELVLYPNPVLKDVSTIVSIKTSKEYRVKTVEIFNVFGIREHSAYTLGELDTSTLNKGVYIVRCNGFRKGYRFLVTRKLIVK